jgi:hypothetical protein
MSDPNANRFVLRDLPVAPRLVIALFLMSVGFGYFSALIQLHFQGATAGRALPSPEDAVATYHGRTGMSQIERLLVTDDTKPFNGSGSMKAAFTVRSGGLGRATKEKAKALNLDPKNDKDLKRAKEALFSERDGERRALLAWLHAGADEASYSDDKFVLPARLANFPITEKYLESGPDGVKTVRIKKILEDRCVRCHSDGVGGPASNFPLDKYERVKEYTEVETVGGGMSLTKLAQTTHVHLLGFAMLYGLTGLTFAFTSWPGVVRAVLAPFTLLAQLVDISCWWMARYDPLFGKLIVFTGGAVAVSLFLQIVLSLFNLFGAKGKLVLVLLLATAGFGGYTVKQRVIDPFLENERVGAVGIERTGNSSEE